jgi:glycine/D-amino acid oxidase-like deaminating enzyme
MENREVDFLIIGQGIAGSLTAHCLRKESKSIVVIDNNHLGSASKIAAGIINPIIGKQYTLSWQINDFLPVAIEMYSEISKLLNIEVFKRHNLIRIINNVEEENFWLSRTGDPLYIKYMENKADVDDFKGFIKPSFNYGEVKGSIQVNLPLILDGYRKLLIAENSYTNDIFEYDKLVIDDNIFNYKGIKSKHIIFCEGYKGASNPFFSKIKFVPAKGEVLIIRIPGAKFKKMYKNKVFLVQLENEIYWCGGGYEWNSPHDLPTEEGKQNLKNELNKFLEVPFEVIDHKAAIRPTIQDRRPIIKEHDSIPNMYTLNGMGTKGTAIAPLAAIKLVKYIKSRKPEDLLF